MKPEKIHAFGYKEKTVCGLRLSQVPAFHVSGRMSIVNCGRCLRTLDKEGDSAIPPKYHPVLYRPSWFTAVVTGVPLFRLRRAV